MGDSIQDKLDKLFSLPDKTMREICAHVASGGSLIDLCETWGVRYGEVVAWVREDKDRSRRWVDAQNDRAEWAKERILLELNRIGMADIRKIFDDEGRILPVHAWPSEVASFVSSIETVEEFEGQGREREQIGWNKKVKLWNKERALELLGKNLHLFIDRVEHSGKLTLEELVMASREDKEEPSDE